MSWKSNLTVEEFTKILLDFQQVSKKIGENTQELRGWGHDFLRKTFARIIYFLFKTLFKISTGERVF